MDIIKSENIQKLHDMLTSAGSPVIVTHMRPDGDAIGSSLGMYHTLRLYGKKAKLALVNPAPANLDFLLTADVMEDILIHETDKEATEDRKSVV